MSIFKDLKDAAEYAHLKGDYEREKNLDRLNVLVGESNRVHNQEMTTESFQLYHAVWTQALVLLGDHPRRVA